MMTTVKERLAAALWSLSGQAHRCHKLQAGNRRLVEGGNQLRAELAESRSVREDLVKEVEAAVDAFAREKTSGSTEGG